MYDIDTSIILVNYNCAKYVKGLFESLKSQTNQNFQVIVFNNRSDDGSVEDTTAPELSETIDPGRQIVEQKNQIAHPINHYVLLPLYAWGAANWELSMVEALLQESHPAIGFYVAISVPSSNSRST